MTGENKLNSRFTGRTNEGEKYMTMDFLCSSYG